jgi:hypothetical protein
MTSKVGFRIEGAEPLDHTPRSWSSGMELECINKDNDVSTIKISISFSTLT